MSTIRENWQQNLRHAVYSIVMTIALKHNKDLEQFKSWTYSYNITSYVEKKTLEKQLFQP